MNEPENFTLNVEGELFEATPRNTTLQEYAGHLSMYNNILLENVDENDVTTNAMIIFSESETYLPLRDIIEAHHFPMYLNIPKVGEGIISAYVTMNMDDLEEMPDWMDDGPQS